MKANTSFLISDLEQIQTRTEFNAGGELVAHERTEHSKSQTLDRELMSIGVTNLRKCQMVKKRQSAQRRKR